MLRRRLEIDSSRRAKSRQHKISRTGRTSFSFLPVYTFFLPKRPTPVLPCRSRNRDAPSPRAANFLLFDLCIIPLAILTKAFLPTFTPRKRWPT